MSVTNGAGANPLGSMYGAMSSSAGTGNGSLGSSGSSAGGMFSGVASGALAGAALGPLGAIGGAAIGFLGSVIGSLGQRKAEKEALAQKKAIPMYKPSANTKANMQFQANPYGVNMGALSQMMPKASWLVNVKAPNYMNGGYYNAGARVPLNPAINQQAMQPQQPMSPQQGQPTVQQLYAQIAAMQGQGMA